MRMEQALCSIPEVWEKYASWKQLSCVPSEGEDCTPLVLGGYTVVEDKLVEGRKEYFTGVSTGILAAIVAAVVVVIIIVIVIFVALRGRRRRQEEFEKAQEAYEEQLDEEALADAEEGDFEFIIVREARPYVVGYKGFEREDPMPVKEPVPAIEERKPSPFRNVHDGNRGFVVK